MATRLYPERLQPADITLTQDAEWDYATGFLNLRLSRVKMGATAGTSGTFTDSTATSNRDTLVAQLVSPPIKSQTIAGTLKGQGFGITGNASQDLRSQVIARVVSNDGSTVRGVLYAGDLATLTGDPSSEWTTGFVNRMFPRGGAASLSSVTAQDGDRIVIEMGARKHAAASSSAQMYIGSILATDLPEDETDTGWNTKAGWFEFSQDILFKNTRFYTAPAATSPLTSQGYDAEWENVASAARRKLNTVITGAAPETSSVNDTTATSNRDILGRQYISDPIAAGPINCTFWASLNCNENTTSVNARAQIIVKLISNDGSVERGYLYAGDLTTGTGDPANEFSNSGYQSRLFPRGAPITLNTLVAQTDDRILVEIGWRKHAAAGGIATISFSDNANVDLDGTETDNSGNSWVEFIGIDLFTARPMGGARAYILG